MADLVDIIVELLCQRDTVSQCQQFLSDYPDVTQQLLWLVFFPSIFMIILFIYMQDGILKTPEHKKLKGLLAVAFFLFVVFQGWYYYALVLSKYWFISVILLGAVFVVVNKMGAAGGGGGGGNGHGGKKSEHGYSSKAEGLAKGYAKAYMKKNNIKFPTPELLMNESKILGLIATEDKIIQDLTVEIDALGSGENDRTRSELVKQRNEAQARKRRLEHDLETGKEPD